MADKFGDLGLTGIVSLTADGKSGLIEDSALSWRVMGLNVEDLMLHVAVEAAAALELERVEARYV